MNTPIKQKVSKILCSVDYFGKSWCNTTTDEVQLKAFNVTQLKHELHYSCFLENFPKFSEPLILRTPLDDFFCSLSNIVKFYHGFSWY